MTIKNKIDELTTLNENPVINCRTKYPMPIWSNFLCKPLWKVNLNGETFGDVTDTELFNIANKYGLFIFPEKVTDNNVKFTAYIRAREPVTVSFKEHKDDKCDVFTVTYKDMQFDVDIYADLTGYNYLDLWFKLA